MTDHRTLGWAVRNEVARMVDQDYRRTWWPPVGSWEHILLCRAACRAIWRARPFAQEATS